MAPKELPARPRDFRECKTQLQLTERAARQSEKQLRDMVETIPAMVWITLADGACVFVNQRWQDFTGREALLEDGRSFQEVAAERGTLMVAKVNCG